MSVPPPNSRSTLERKGDQWEESNHVSSLFLMMLLTVSCTSTWREAWLGREGATITRLSHVASLTVHAPQWTAYTPSPRGYVIDGELLQLGFVLSDRHPFNMHVFRLVLWTLLTNRRF